MIGETGGVPFNLPYSKPELVPKTIPIATRPETLGFLRVDH